METARPAATKGAWWSHLYVQVLAAIALGVLVGHFWPEAGVALKPLGDAFIKLVKMIVAPVIFLTLVTGIAGMAGVGALGRVVGKAFAYFFAVSTLALIVGLAVANIVRPGAGMNIDPATLDASRVADFTAQAHEATLTGFLLAIIPDTLPSGLADGNILQVLLVAVLLGLAIGLVGEKARPLLAVLESAAHVVFRLVGILMRAAPIGAFGAMAFTIGQYGLGALAGLAGLVATFYLTSLGFILIVLGLIARAAGFSLIGLLRYLKDDEVPSTSSSSSLR